MKVKELFEGKEEKFKVVTKTEDGTRETYFRTRDEMNAYAKKIKEKLGVKLKTLWKLKKNEWGEGPAAWGALKEDVENVVDNIKQEIEKYEVYIQDSKKFLDYLKKEPSAELIKYSKIPINKQHEERTKKVHEDIKRYEEKIKELKEKMNEILKNK